MTAPVAGRTWPHVLGGLVRREDLDPGDAAWAMGEVLAGRATPAQIGAFAALLRAKGETPAELAALIRTMQAVAVRVPVEAEGADGPLVDTCGTGGDRAGTFNISTVAALVAAAAGARVAKHGNRAASSACGSADLLEALGVRLEVGPDGVARCIRQAGIGFCFAPRFHPALRHAAAARRELGIPTTFNFLGPLANPAGVRRQVVGVSDPRMADRLLGALAELGTVHAMVVFGHDGLDELTTADVSTVRELRGGAVQRYVLDPTELGLARATVAELAGGDPAANAVTARALLDGSGPERLADVVCLNAAAALIVAGIAAGWEDGLARARSALDGGGAAERLAQLITCSARGPEEG